MYETPFHHTPFDKQSFLVTGGAGFIGSHIVEYLLKYNAGKVRVLDNLLTGSESNVELFKKYDAYEFVPGDIRDLETCLRACDEIDYVFHEAALGSVQRSFRDPITTHSINADGFLNVLLAVKQSKVKRLVYASSSSVYGDHPDLPKREDVIGKPLSPYAVSKYSNELYAKVFADHYGMELIGLRYFNVFGPRQPADGSYAAVIPSFIRALTVGQSPIIYGDGSQSRDFTFIENVVQANIKAMLSENPLALNQVYNVAFGKQYSILQLYELIKSILKIEIAPRFDSSRAGDIIHSLADISKAETLLHYQPIVVLEDGLKITLLDLHK